VDPNLKKFRKTIFSPPLRPEKYVESIGEIRFQIRSQSREIFAFFVTATSALSNTPQRSVYNYARRPILGTGLRPVQLLLVLLLNADEKGSFITALKLVDTDV